MSKRSGERQMGFSQRQVTSWWKTCLSGSNVWSEWIFDVTDEDESKGPTVCIAYIETTNTKNAWKLFRRLTGWKG